MRLGRIQVFSPIRPIWLVGSVLFVLSACDPSSRAHPVEGHALSPNNGFTFVIKVVPGDQWSLQIAYLENISTTPLTLQSVRAEGQGSDIVAVEQAQVAVSPTSAADKYKWVQSGEYKTFPPTERIGSRDLCNEQQLVPIQGYVLAPGQSVHIAVLLRAIGAGPFAFHHVVDYQQGDQFFYQPIVSGVRGQVVAGGKPFPPNPLERYCFSHGAKELPVGH